MPRLLIVTTDPLVAAEAARLGYDPMMPGRPQVRVVDPTGQVLDGGGPVEQTETSATDEAGALIVVDVSSAPTTGPIPETQRGQMLAALATLGASPAWRRYWYIPPGAKPGTWDVTSDGHPVLYRRQLRIGGDARPGKLHQGVSHPSGWRQLGEMIDDADRDAIEALLAE